MGPDQEQEFYAELDQKTKKPKKKSACTCQTMAIGFGVLFVLIAIFVFWAIGKIKEKKVPEEPLVISQVVLENFEQKLKNLKTSVSQTPTPGAQTQPRQVQIEITSAELTALIQNQVSKDPDFPLKNPIMTIYPDRIDLLGTLQKPFKTDITLELVPRVEGGKVILELGKVKAGSLSIPDFIVRQVSSRLEDSLSQQLDKVTGLTVTQIQLASDKVTITGTITPQK